MKKLVSIFLALALIVTLIPVYGPASQVDAAGSFFIFPNEKDKKDSARIVSSKYVTLNGTINGVVGSSISYKVEQITAINDTVLNSTEDITTGITTTGDNQLTVSNVELFPGLNKITFKGVAGTSTQEESIYIEFRDSPMLNDLRILFENQAYDVLEDGVTMLYTSAQTQASTGVITIDGYAPNATKVTVDINNYSYDFNVSQTGNFRFTTSQLTINKGMNAITFKVTNAGQIIETTRQVMLYSGEVTYYNEKLDNNNIVYDLSNNGNYSVDMSEDLKLTGKAIIPWPLYDVVNNGTTEVPISDIRNVLERNMSMEIDGVTPQPTLEVIGWDPVTPNDKTRYITVDYSYLLPSTLSFNTPIKVTMISPNFTQFDDETTRQFTLRDGTKAFIADVNYLSGYDANITSRDRIIALQSTDIDPLKGVEVYAMPMAVELLIANHSKLGLPSTIESQLSATINGISYPDKPFKLIKDTNGNLITEEITRKVDGIDVTYLRVFLEFSKLDKSGTNNIGFTFTDATNASTDVKYAIFKTSVWTICEVRQHCEWYECQLRFL